MNFRKKTTQKKHIKALNCILTFGAVGDIKIKGQIRERSRIMGNPDSCCKSKDTISDMT